MEELKKQTDHIDWLVSNAGISTYAKYEDYSFEEWTRIVNTNLSVPVFMVKELRSMMVEGGSVLFLGFPMQDSRRILPPLYMESPRQPSIS